MVPPRSASPATAATWLAMVAMTGFGVSGSNSAELASAIPARWRAASMTMHCRPRHRPSAGMPRSRACRSAPTLPSMPRMPKPPGIDDPVQAGERSCRAGRRLARVGRHPADVHLGPVGEPAGPQRLDDRQVGIGQVDVLADEPDGDVGPRVVHPVEQVAPHRPVDVAERQAEPAHDVGVQALGVQHLGDLVDARRVDRGHDGLGVDVAHQRDLALEALGQLAVGAADHRVRARCRCCAARRPSAASAWSSARRTGAR